MPTIITLLPSTRVVPVEHWQLVDKETGRQVFPGDKFVTRDGDHVVLRGGTPPTKPSSTGRVHCYVEERDLDHYWFPSVVDLMWVEVDDD